MTKLGVVRDLFIGYTESVITRYKKMNNGNKKLLKVIFAINLVQLKQKQNNKSFFQKRY